MGLRPVSRPVKWGFDPFPDERDRNVTFTHGLGGPCYGWSLSLPIPSVRIELPAIISWIDPYRTQIMLLTDPQWVLRQSIQLFEKNANDRKQFVIDTISNALSCAKDLASNLKNSGLLNLLPNTNGEDIAKALVENDLPVKLLDDIVDHWSRLPLENKFIAEDASEFHLIKEILVMESLPAEDRSQFRHALLEAKRFGFVAQDQGPVRSGCCRVVVQGVSALEFARVQGICVGSLG
jgi:hypothetical protein